MAHLSAFHRELDALEALHAQIGAITARSDDRRRYDLIQYRRVLTAQIAAVGQAGEAIFSDGLEQEQFRAKFSKMRSMTAMHQASWPAVLLGERPDDFRESSKPMRAANREFIAWARAAIAARR